ESAFVPEMLQESRRENSHISGQHDEIDVVSRQFLEHQALVLLAGQPFTCDGHCMDPILACDVKRQGLPVVGDDHMRVCLEVAVLDCSKDSFEVRSPTRYQDGYVD